MTLESFVEMLRSQTAGKPTLPLNTPRRLSRRPIFVG